MTAQDRTTALDDAPGHQNGAEPAQSRSEPAEPASPHDALEPLQPELIETGSLRRNVEALLFVASEALTIKQIAKLTGGGEIEVTQALAQVESDFAERGLVVRKVAGGYRFATAPVARDVVEAYLLPPKTSLSPAAMETLAIVAYNELLEGEATTKAEIEGIRGVNADSVVATLLDRRFIAESGRKEVVGRPILYRTTPEFLEAFGLPSLDELPKIDVGAAGPIELSLPMNGAGKSPANASGESSEALETEESTGAQAAVIQEV